MFTVHPKEIERYALRTLLLYRKGCGSFEALRTVDGVIYTTFRETCEKLGYCEKDNDIELAFKEAVENASSYEIRDLFALILLNCQPNNPRKLWEQFKYGRRHHLRIKKNRSIC